MSLNENKDNIYKYNEYKSEIYKTREKQIEVLKKIPQHEQKSEAWFKQRDEMITASDIGSAVDLNHYQKRYQLVLKKCGKGPEYKDNIFVHHGKKYEEIATKIYEFRYNIKVDEYGLIPHPNISYIGASPDGICSKYTLNGKLSKMIGRMLEIKCPLRREIKLEGEVYGEICPEYYWAQVQVQLEVCDLDECDFWQCKIEEYNNRKEFVEDTNNTSKKTKHLSMEHNMEKGAVIQLLPKSEIADPCVFSSKYIYPPKIDMSPEDYDLWILESLENIDKDYYFDRVIYWKLTKACNVMIKRDKKWFKKVLPQIKDTWDYIEYYRNNENMLDRMCEFVESKKYKRDNNNVIMKYMKNDCKKKDLIDGNKNIFYKDENNVECMLLSSDDELDISDVD
jgi:putative phage-type endonuclease